MKRLLTILPLLSLALAGCYREPYADAYIEPNPAYVGEDVYFTNTSAHADYVEWDLGDGTTSSAYNVTHYYYDPGLYDVHLRAFGNQGSVDHVSFVVEVWGSELEIEVRELYDEYLIEGISVMLYPTYQDWLDFTNPVDEQFTNQYGKCYFSGLSYQRYYVDVYSINYDNWYLGETDPETWIETQMLPGGWDHTFIAYVQYYESTNKKSATATRPADREFRVPERSGADLPLRENKLSIEKSEQE